MVGRQVIVTTLAAITTTFAPPSCDVVSASEPQTWCLPASVGPSLVARWHTVFASDANPPVLRSVSVNRTDAVLDILQGDKQLTVRLVHPSRGTSPGACPGFGVVGSAEETAIARTLCGDWPETPWIRCLARSPHIPFGVAAALYAGQVVLLGIVFFAARNDCFRPKRATQPDPPAAPRRTT